MSPARTNATATKTSSALPHLDHARKEIRLLQICSGQDHDLIVCKVTVARLGKLLAGPRFLALSFTRGENEESRPIVVNGSSFNININLEAALRQLRSFHGSADDVPYRNADTYLWIDLLCTDQENDIEKAYQISIISDILTSATRVVIWLGEGNEASDSFLDWVRTVWLPPDILEVLWRRPGTAVRGHLYLNRAGRARLARNTFAATTDDTFWLSLAILFRPWFARIWTVQEASIVKKDPIIICGCKSVSLVSLAAILKLTHDDNGWLAARPSASIQKLLLLSTDINATNPTHLLQEFHAMHEKVDCMMNMRLSLSRGYPPNLEQALDWTSKHQSTSDPREKVFGLLGVLKKDVRAKIQINYDHTLAQVTTQAILGACETSAFLDSTLSYMHRSEVPSSQASWLPDFAGSSNIFDESFRAYEASWQGVSRFQASADRMTINLESTVLDSIVASKALDFDQNTSKRDWQEVERIAASGRSTKVGKDHPLLPFKQTVPTWSVLLFGKEVELLGEFETPKQQALYQQLWEILIQGQVPPKSLIPSDITCFTSWWWQDPATFTIFAQEIEQRSYDLALFSTAAGFLGVGPKTLKAGDEIVILHGTQSISVVRSSGTGRYSLLGPAFVSNLTGKFKDLSAIHKKGWIKSKTVTLV